MASTPSLHAHPLRSFSKVPPSPPCIDYRGQTSYLFVFKRTHQFTLQSSGRISNFPQERENSVNYWRSWTRNRGDTVSEDYDDDDDDEDEDDEEEDRSLDLLIRFVQNVFRKISKRARKAVKSVLPFTVSTKLVGFSVNGAIILAFLWLLKAFLEVICTLGSVLFASILLIRGIWVGISYLQDTRNHMADDDGRPAWTQTQQVF